MTTIYASPVHFAELSKLRSAHVVYSQYMPPYRRATRGEMPWWRWLLAVLRIIDWPRVSYVYVVPT